jgi:hypothetical protein
VDASAELPTRIPLAFTFGRGRSGLASQRAITVSISSSMACLSKLIAPVDAADLTVYPFRRA